MGIKRAVAMLMVLCACFGLIACGGESEKDPYTASQADIDYLNSKYEGRVPYYGDLHDHSRDGLCEDGDTKFIRDWLPAMDALDMDFQAMMNHHNIYHMYSKDWDNSRLIGGSEPATNIIDSKATDKSMHHNMIVPTAQALIDVVQSIPKFNYTGGKNGVPLEQGWFDYANFTTAEMQDLIQKIKDQGGLWVNVHPKQQMQSDDPLDYFFADYTGMEVFYIARDNQETKDNYALWTELLSMGKRLWATAGCDEHDLPRGKTLNVIYSEKKDGATYVSHLAKGDFVCGSVGIRMVIGDATMGGHTDFNGKRVVLSTGDFHSLSAVADHKYRVDVISDKGVVFSKEITLDTAYFAFDADESASFYRVEVHDTSRSETLLAIGNPIWND